MESTITIDIDTDNNPVIKIMYKYSTDVKDTLVKRFLDAFGDQWNGEAKWHCQNAGNTGTMSIIRPTPKKAT